MDWATVTSELRTSELSLITYYPLSINTNIHCPLIRGMTTKERSNRIQRYIQILIQKSLQVIFSLNNFLPFWLKHQSVFGKHHTSVLFFFSKLSCSFASKTRSTTTSSIQWNEVLNLVIFLIIRSYYFLIVLYFRVQFKAFKIIRFNFIQP